MQRIYSARNLELFLRLSIAVAPLFLARNLGMKDVQAFAAKTPQSSDPHAQFGQGISARVKAVLDILNRLIEYKGDDMSNCSLVLDILNRLTARTGFWLRRLDAVKIPLRAGTPHCGGKSLFFASAR
ncbi:MAG: hypothetical protein ACLUKN_00855 [Bacilli bacterium]